MNNDLLVQFKNVSFRYENEEGEEQNPLAVKNVNLDIRQGECIAILGHNGSGKSTLAKLSNSILIPTEGSVIVDSMDTSDEEKSYEIRKTVGVVFQNPDNQIVSSIVEEDVAFGPENLGLPREEIRKRVDDSLKAVGMYEHRLAEPHKLSGGQKQRVAIAGIIAMLPKCIFFDEPTAMLDPQGRKEVMKTIFKLNREYNITVVYITHFMEEAVLADRVVVMDNAGILMQGTPKEVFSHGERLVEIGLDVPQVMYLSKALKQNGVNIDTDILYEDEFTDKFTALFGEKNVTD
ncbi:MAG: energy-coupling factor transporter ATPase [Clostridia bacterium]|nr:energy-coupling factor transporter ATPase [Clostridia bacterium]